MRSLACVAALVALSSAGVAEAGPPSMAWPEENPRFHWTEYTFTGALLVLNVFNDFIFPGIDRELWHGGILWDDGLDRWAEKLDGPDNDRYVLAGDIIMYGLMAFPFVVDALLVSYLLNGSGDVAWQITMIGTEALLTSSLLNLLAKRYVTRNRPGTPRCIGEEVCPNGSAIHSFYSGHAAQMFAGAGLICANHMHLKVFRNRAADVATCGASLALATAGAFSRLTNRSHYASDVAIGAGIGLALGYLMPFLLHYREGVITPMAGESIGVGYSRSF